MVRFLFRTFCTLFSVILPPQAIIRWRGYYMEPRLVAKHYFFVPLQVTSVFVKAASLRMRTYRDVLESKYLKGVQFVATLKTNYPFWL